MLALAGILGYAQSTNPQNYSGRMYVEAIEIIATPRYVSYEDHAILSQQMRIPSVEITKIDMDFEKGIVTAKEIEMKIKVNGCKGTIPTAAGWLSSMRIWSTKATRPNSSGRNSASLFSNKSQRPTMASKSPVWFCPASPILPMSQRR